MSTPRGLGRVIKVSSGISLSVCSAGTPLEKQIRQRKASRSQDFLMQHPRHAQCEFGNGGLEFSPVFGHHLITAFHGAYGRGDG